MSHIITQNSALTGIGVVLEIKTNRISTVDLTVEDNGGGSTLTFESSADDSTWSTMTTGVYNVTSGAMVANAGTTTAKGKYVVDVSTIGYLRIRVSTYVSGTVVTRFEDSVVSLRGSFGAMLTTGLVAQGTTQATALPLSGSFNVFGTVAASTGCVLPAGLNKNGEVLVKNNGANTLNVFPPLGGKINGGTANAAVTVAAAAALRLISDGVGNYWTF